MKVNSYFIILLFLIMLPLVSSNGLAIVNGNDQNLTKTFGVEQKINFTIKNEENFVFYDINFEDNEILSMETITELAPGEEVNVTANITAIESFNGDINILGYKEANVGASNQTIDIDVDYDNGLSLCEKTLIIGDKVVWHNLVSDEIQLWNDNTNQEVTTIYEDQNYSKTFNIAEDFRYHFKRHGTVKFTSSCTLSIRDDTGRVNYPEYDVLFNIDLSVNYSDTTIKLTILENNYTLDYDSEAEGVLTIKNIGTKLAKSVKLVADWFAFNKNNFDILPGETVVISYLIDPRIYTTENTGKYHNMSLNVTGNFEDLSENFTIYINYAEISGDNFNGSSIAETLARFCLDNPNTLGCLETKIIYKNIDTGEYEFNVTYNQKQVNDLWDYMFSQSDSQSIFESIVKEDLDLIASNVSLNSQIIVELKNLAEQNKKEFDEAQKDEVNYVLVGIIGSIIIVLIILLFYVFRMKRRKIYENLY